MRSRMGMRRKWSSREWRNGQRVREKVFTLWIAQQELILYGMIGGPAIVPALLKSLCRVYQPSHGNLATLSTDILTQSDINRLHPIGGDFNQHAISNLQSSTTGHHLEGVEDGSGFQARILVLNNTPERGSGGYVGLMNGVFAAQKRVSGLSIRDKITNLLEKSDLCNSGRFDRKRQ